MNGAVFSALILFGSLAYAKGNLHIDRSQLVVDAGTRVELEGYAGTVVEVIEPWLLKVRMDYGDIVTRHKDDFGIAVECLANLCEGRIFYWDDGPRRNKWLVSEIFSNGKVNALMNGNRGGHIINGVIAGLWYDFIQVGKFKPKSKNGPYLQQTFCERILAFASPAAN